LLLAVLFRLFGFLAPKDFRIICLSNILTLRLHDEDFTEALSCGLNSISTFLLLLYN
jgi:hypothetical protein